MKFDDPRVILLGAGASRGGLRECYPPPPVDNEFFLVANQLKGHGTPVLAKKVLRSVWALYGRIEGIGLEQYYRDIETRELIGNIAKSRNRQKDWAQRKEDLEELIRRVYIQTTTDLSKVRPTPRKSSVHERLLNGLNDKSTIMTFNYDLIIEESFTSTKYWNPHNGYGMTIHGKTHEWPAKWYEQRCGEGVEKKSKIPLLKLHGSLGWASYKNKEIKLKHRPYTVRKNKYEEISIQPPGWNKKIDVNPYKKLWREARLRLERCKSLMIIGYSLPETDLLAIALFAEVVRKRVADCTTLKQLVLVDPNDIVRRKFIELFTPTLGATGKVMQLEDINDID